MENLLPEEVSTPIDKVFRRWTPVATPSPFSTTPRMRLLSPPEFGTTNLLKTVAASSRRPGRARSPILPLAVSDDTVYPSDLTVGIVLGAAGGVTFISLIIYIIVTRKYNEIPNLGVASEEMDGDGRFHYEELFNVPYSNDSRIYFTGKKHIFAPGYKSKTKPGDRLRTASFIDRLTLTGPKTEKDHSASVTAAENHACDSTSHPSGQLTPSTEAIYIDECLPIGGASSHLQTSRKCRDTKHLIASRPPIPDYLYWHDMFS